MSSTDGTARLLDSVRSCLEAQGVARGSLLLVACSGGPDSTALADALWAVSSERGLRLALGYLDHGMRPEPERRAEREAVVALAERCGAPLVSGGVEAGLLASRAASGGGSLEDLARRERHRFLEREASDLGASYIAIGHTADDVAETVLMRVLQGVDVSGLGGIPERRGRIIRPLYYVGREDVLRYLRSRGLGAVTDSSNVDPRYLRNRIRSELVPAVARVFPSYRSSLLALAEKARATQRYVDRAAAVAIPWTGRVERLRTPWAGFRAADAVLRIAAVYAALDQLGGGRIPRRLLAPLAEELQPAKRGVLISGCGFRVERRGEWVYAEADVVRRGKIGYLVHIRTSGDYAIVGCGVKLQVACRLPDKGTGSFVQGGPLVLRSRRPGDRVRSHGRWVELDRLTAAACGPDPRGELVPVLADRSGIARVLGSAVGGRDAVADREQIGSCPDPAISVAVTVEEL